MVQFLLDKRRVLQFNDDVVNGEQQQARCQRVAAQILADHRVTGGAAPTEWLADVRAAAEDGAYLTRLLEQRREAEGSVGAPSQPVTPLLPQGVSWVTGGLMVYISFPRGSSRIW